MNGISGKLNGLKTTVVAALGKSPTADRKVTYDPRDQKIIDAYDAAINGEIAKLHTFLTTSPLSFAPLILYIVSKRSLPALKSLFEAGAAFDHEDTKTDTKMVLDYVFEDFKDTSDVKCFELLEYIFFRISPVRSLMKLRQYVKQKDFDPEQLRTLAKWIIAGSQEPVLTALDVAEFFKDMGDLFVVDQQTYLEIRDYFSQMALSFLGEVESDHLTSMIIGSTDALGRCPLGVAIQNKDKTFIGDSRITRILTTLWTTPLFLTDHFFSSGGATTGGLVQLMVTDPEGFIRLPLGKFIIESLSFVGFLALYSWLCLTRPDVTSQQVNWKEWILWVCVASFMAGEVQELKAKGSTEYFRDVWNRLDCVIYIVFVVMFVCRLSNSSQLNLYSVFVTINAVLLWIRVSHLFVINPTMGPLLQMVRRMAQDVVNFFFLIGVFTIGFAFGFTFLVADPDADFLDCAAIGQTQGECKIGEFHTLANSIFYLWQALLGQFDFGWFDAINPKISRVFARWWLSFYLGLANIVLLNLLIAMMSQTYNSIQESAILEFAFGRAELIWKLDQKDNELPPPWNIVVWTVYLLITGFEYLLTCGRNMRAEAERFKSSGTLEVRAMSARLGLTGNEAKNNDAVHWYCHYCHHENKLLSPQEVRREVEKWIKGLDKKTSRETDDTDVELLNSELVICTNCFRNFNGIGPQQLRREKISARVFQLLMAYPLAIVLCVPMIAVFAFDYIKSSLDKKQAARELQQIQQDAEKTESGGVLRRGQARKTKWVQAHLASDTRDLNSVYQKLSLIESVLLSQFPQAGDVYSAPYRKWEDIYESVGDRVEKLAQLSLPENMLQRIRQSSVVEGDEKKGAPERGAESRATSTDVLVPMSSLRGVPSSSDESQSRTSSGDALAPSTPAEPLTERS